MTVRGLRSRSRSLNATFVAYNLNLLVNLIDLSVHFAYLYTNLSKKPKSGGKLYRCLKFKIFALILNNFAIIKLLIEIIK